MAQYYECMRCRSVTVLVALPARCKKCGGGTGVVFQREDGRAAVDPNVNPPASSQYESADLR